MVGLIMYNLFAFSSGDEGSILLVHMKTACGKWGFGGGGVSLSSDINMRKL